MTPIAVIKTKADALALIEAISTPAAQPLPEPLADDATPAHKAAHANTVDLLQTANANAFAAQTNANAANASAFGNVTNQAVANANALAGFTNQSTANASA